tara:strand:- start:306 stop:503 length:198 start_codon:yes stop_codon:yes gene_type:complete
LPVNERREILSKLLVTFDEIGFDHYRGDGVASFSDLVTKFSGNFGLLPIILLRVSMGAIDHEVWG